ncbi:MAG TPA: 2OG-Fe(II) oxygenase [Rhizomicrobium sp.]|nr:2OG-Fe(II) oxygenase [Rhizomicrobium sp.]
MTPTHAVIDEFLAPREHRALWDAFARTADTRNWNRAFSAVDGGAGVPERSLRDDTAGGEPGPPELRVVGEKLFARMTAAPPLALAPWTGFTQSLWTFRAGMGLAWHTDQGWLAGWIYYMHPQWRDDWGGALLVAEDGARDPVPIAPAPNRLVLVRGGARHCIGKVEPAAGTAARTSVSGFFF